MSREPRSAARWVAAAVVSALLVGCSGAEPAATAPTEPIMASPTSTPPPPPDRDGDGTPDSADRYPDDPLNTPVVEVVLACYLDDTFDGPQHVFSIRGEPDFSEAWAQTPYSCDAERNGSVPLSAIEQQALDASGYTDRADIKYLYSMCAEVDSTDTYTAGDHAASPEQAAEITGALTLCPDHPLAAQMKAAITRGKADAELEAAGRLFGSGTYLVGDEIKPGTYYVEGHVDGCYWERQDSAGEIIDNNFVGSGRRVEVTIRSSDYAFSSNDCGQWRPIE